MYKSPTTFYMLNHAKLNYIFSSMSVFLASFNWLSFTEDWVTVSRTLQCIQNYFNRAVVWRVSIIVISCPLSHFFRAPNITDNTATFIFYSPWEFYGFHFLKQILVYAWIISQYRQMLTPSTIASKSSTCAKFYILSVQICCISLLCY